MSKKALRESLKAYGTVLFETNLIHNTSERRAGAGSCIFERESIRLTAVASSKIPATGDESADW